MRQLIKQVTPRPLADFIHRKLKGKGIPYCNVYHCCTWKSASQWFVDVFSHPSVIEYSEMNVVTFSQWFQGLRDKGLVDFERPDDVRHVLANKVGRAFEFPAKAFVTTVYLSLDQFLNAPLRPPFKAFFVLRDPRDLVVSYYFSMKDSHTPHPWVLELRKRLQACDEAAGLMLAIQNLCEEGVFDSMRSWLMGARTSPHLRTFRYEDLAGDHRAFLGELFAWISLRLPDEAFERVVADTAFERLTGGRSRGEAQQMHHLRKGVAGDWVNHLGAEHLDALKNMTGDICSDLGYR